LKEQEYDEFDYDAKWCFLEREDSPHLIIDRNGYKSNSNKQYNSTCRITVVSGRKPGLASTK
jgi:hypothetical protein